MSRQERRLKRRKVAKARERRGKMRGWTPWSYTDTAIMPDGRTVPVAESGFQFIASNGLYHVMARRLEAEAEGMPAGLHLSIRRNDRKPIRDWRHLQRIKNELAGEDWEAVELYPAEDRKVDMANQYHLWCWPFRLPFGFQERDVEDEPLVDGAVQRPGATDG